MFLIDANVVAELRKVSDGRADRASAHDSTLDDGAAALHQADVDFVPSDGHLGHGRLQGQQQHVERRRWPSDDVRVRLEQLVRPQSSTWNGHR